jgi:sulfur-carrier protein
MKIKIKVFAALKDYFEPEFEMDVSRGITVADAMNMIMIRNSFALPVLTKCRIAVNENFVESDYNIKENEELFIIPPSSGG